MSKWLLSDAFTDPGHTTIWIFVFGQLITIVVSVVKFAALGGKLLQEFRTLAVDKGKLEGKIEEIDSRGTRYSHEKISIEDTKTGEILNRIQKLEDDQLRMISDKLDDITRRLSTQAK